MKRFCPPAKRILKNLPSSFVLTLFLVLPFLLLPQVQAASQEELSLFLYINQERIRTGLTPLTWSDDLREIALEHSHKMSATGIVEHEGLDGSLPHERIYKRGLYVSKTAENVAADINAVSAHTALMYSLYHRKNILTPEFTQAGVGVVSKNKILYITELFSNEIPDVSTSDARKQMLDACNVFRKKAGYPALIFSETLNNFAQGHVENQENKTQLSSPAARSILPTGGTLKSTAYTTDSLSDLPPELQKHLRSVSTKIGIGYKRIRGKLCESGCYLITAVIN